MEYRFFLVDAFTDRAFRGNQAAVFLVDDAFPVEAMRMLAAETNCAESAFVLMPPDPYPYPDLDLYPESVPGRIGAQAHVDNGARPVIRWFTPLREVSLCGHATLAAAAVLFEGAGQSAQEPGADLEFDSASGRLSVSRNGFATRNLCMDFPADTWDEIYPDPAYARALGLIPVRGSESGYGLSCPVLYGRSTKKAVFIVDSPEQVESLTPDFRTLLDLPDPRIRYGIGVSAPGREGFDFESRYFNPWFGVDEDSVTGSVHTLLGPWWGARLGKTKLAARQLSRRGGELGVECAGNRVRLSGSARIVLRGTLDASALADIR